MSRKSLFAGGDRRIPAPKFLGHIATDGEKLDGTPAILRGFLFERVSMGGTSSGEPENGVRNLSEALKDTEFLPLSRRFDVLDNYVMAAIKLYELGVSHSDMRNMDNALVLRNPPLHSTQGVANEAPLQSNSGTGGDAEDSEQKLDFQIVWVDFGNSNLRKADEDLETWMNGPNSFFQLVDHLSTTTSTKTKSERPFLIRNVAEGTEVNVDNSQFYNGRAREIWKKIPGKDIRNMADLEAYCKNSKDLGLEYRLPRKDGTFEDTFNLGT